MQKYWLAQKSISCEEARALIENQFPELEPVELELIGEGWDNRVFQVNQNLTFRFPRRQVAVELIETEGELLPTIAPYLPTPIPVPQYYGQPTEDFEWPFLGYGFIGGQTISSVLLSKEQRHNLAEALAHFLKALHAIDVKTLTHLNIPGDNLGRMDLPKRLKMNVERLEKALEMDLIEDNKTILAILESTPQVRTQPQECLIHGDFQSRQLLIDDAFQLSGVIDWGDVHIGDPCLDLSILYTLLPPESLEEFQNIYGVIDEESLLLARFRATHLGLMLLLYGHDINNSESFAEGLRILKYCCESFNQGL